MGSKVGKIWKAIWAKQTGLQMDHGFSKITHLELANSIPKLYQKVCDVYTATFKIFIYLIFLVLTGVEDGKGSLDQIMKDF